MTFVQVLEDENLLQLLKADIEYFNKPGNDITDGLSAEDIDELRMLSNEPDTTNTLTEDEFNQLTAKWRTR
ncbi:MAG: hypothetical protein H0X70_12875 [Segetibacter sp.]|nr:hypothetical protein [Segetibacter sp.]